MARARREAPRDKSWFSSRNGHQPSQASQLSISGATLTTIGFDADDTLWQNEQFFQLTQQRLVALLEPYADPVRVRQSLLDVSLRNLEHHGFGIKSFTLAMIETAIEVTDGQAPALVVKEILASAGKCRPRVDPPRRQA